MVSIDPEIDLKRLFRGKGAAHALRRLQGAWHKLEIDAEQQQVLDRLEDLTSPLLLFVVGEGNFGKSSLINALLGTSAAPVSVLPKTWKVDVYQRCQAGDAPGATLKWRGRDEQEHVDIDRAHELVAQQEERASRHRGPNRGTFVSELVQVRWTSQEYQLPDDVVLVDTPGFSQLRSDVEIEDVQVRSAEGIRITAREAFDYWYHRADVVLWVFKATRLNDQDTMQALSQLSRHGRTIVGAVTHMDRVPADRWDEVMEEARGLFGEYVEALYPVVAKGCASTAHESIAALRTDVVVRFFSQAREHKDAAIEQFLRRSGDRLIRWANGERETMQRNLDILQKTRTALAEIRPVKLAACRSSLEAWQQRRMAAALKRCENGFSRLPTDNAELRAMMNAIIQAEPAGQALREELEAMASDTVARFRKVSQQLDLVGIRLTDDKTEVFVQPPDFAGSTTLGVSGSSPSGRINDILSGFEGLGVGLGAGAIGALLLGPIGWGLAIAGLLFGDEIKRSELRGHTKKQIEEWYPTTAQRAIDDFGRTLGRVYESTDKAVLAAFRRFCGDPPESLRERSALYAREILRPFAVRRPSVFRRIFRITLSAITTPVRLLWPRRSQKPGVENGVEPDLSNSGR